ncbi:translesion DNA synthesis-associated protein ImuA [Shewanella sp.]|uniref:translesion DNA synthesis-associated protein ImuA n=1 Tax=Shewanella sp. TaxID=50422 RepID=UPI003D143186
MALADPQLERLLERADLWRGDAYYPGPLGQDSGYPELNRYLGHGGWPAHGLCEIFYSCEGIGELSLVLPLMRRLIPSRSPQAGAASLVSLVAPPHVPYPQQLLMQGIDVSRLLWVDTQVLKEQLWALEQILTSGVSPLVLCWLDQLSTSQARRLQLACEKGESLCVCYLPSKLKSQPHPVPLRLALQPELAGKSYAFATQVDILKRRGGWPAPKFSLSLLPELLAQSLKGDTPSSLAGGQVVQGPWST